VTIIVAVGRLGRDPSTKEVSGTKVCAFSLAVDGRKDSGGNKSTTWLEVRAWGKLAEICQKYLQKGKQVCVTGELSVEQWNTREGEKRMEVRVTADKVKFLDGGEHDKSAVKSRVPRAEIPDEKIPF